VIDILKRIEKERKRQDAKWGVQDHGDFKWNTILMEELGEVSKECFELDQGDYKAAHRRDEELIQVAAVAVAWLESVARRRGFC